MMKIDNMTIGEVVKSAIPEASEGNYGGFPGRFTFNGVSFGFKSAKYNSNMSNLRISSSEDGRIRASVKVVDGELDETEIRAKYEKVLAKVLEKNAEREKEYAARRVRGNRERERLQKVRKMEEDFGLLYSVDTQNGGLALRCRDFAELEAAMKAVRAVRGEVLNG